MPMKILFILNIANRVNSFSYTSMLAAREMGVEFHIAGNWGYASDMERVADEQKYGIRIHQIDFIRAPYDIRNRKAMGQLLELMKRENFDLIHCNTPIGGVLGRLAGRKCGVKKIIYQAHGFHFYKGAPLLNWLVYYPIERWLARYTDALITINREDYALAQKKMRLRNDGKVYYVPGVGIDTAEYQLNEDVRSRKRQELKLSEADVMLLSAGDLNENKNNRVILSAMAKLKDPHVHYYLCGKGELEAELRQLAESQGIGPQVHFLGYRQDMKELLQAADMFVMPSYREGLSRAISEAMASGLPCVVSKIRGNVDLIRQDEGGCLCEPDDVQGFADAIAVLSADPEKRMQMGKFNVSRIKDFEIPVVVKAVSDIYSEVLK